MSSKTSANESSKTNDADTGVTRKAGGISRRHSLIPSALRDGTTEDNDSYQYQASPANAKNNARNDFQNNHQGDGGGVGTSHMNMKIVRDVHYLDQQTTGSSKTSSASNNSDSNEGGKGRFLRSETQDLDAMLDDDFYYEETLDRTSSIQDHAHGNGSGYNGNLGKKK
jgi:hypothetical protein